MASNYGNSADGFGYFADIDGKQEWVWYRGQASWNVGFLHTYPITMFLGVLIAFLSVAYFWKRMKYSWEVLQIMVIIIVPSAIAGARLWYLISEGGWEHWYKFSGLSIQGGVMGAMLAVIPYILSRRHLVDFRTVCGMVIPAVIIGQAIGRWGNFDNHEVYGRIVDGSKLDWLTFIKPHMLIDNNDGAGAHYRYPLFFMESMLNLIGYFVILWLLQRKNWVKPGVPAAIYFIWYGVTRFIMEPLRDPVDIMHIGSVPISSLIAGLWITAGVIFLILWQGFTRPIDKWIAKISPKASSWINKKAWKEYKAIKPIKPRRIFFFGEKVEYKGKFFLYFGQKTENKVKLWLPYESEVKWSKREINKGKRNKNRA